MSNLVKKALIERNKAALKKLIPILIGIILILVFFAGGILLGGYLRDRKIAPLDVNLGGLETSVIQAPELKSKIRWGKEVYIYDLRSKKQYDEGHIRNSISMPVDEMLQRINEIPREKEVVIYCQDFSCKEAGEAAQILEATEYKNYRTLFGGLSDWQAYGYKLDIN